MELNTCLRRMNSILDQGKANVESLLSDAKEGRKKAASMSDGATKSSSLAKIEELQNLH